MIRTLKRRSVLLISRLYNPLINTWIGKVSIKTPLSHPLRDILAALPQFGFNITRLVAYSHARYEKLAVVDIGANIGDTAAFINNYKDLPVLCIDGDPAYLQLLHENVKQFKHTVVCEALVGEETSTQKKGLIREKGTAFLTDISEAMQFRSIENILADYPQFGGKVFLKIDTDGFDSAIIRGAARYLANKEPILFFEYDPGLIVDQNENPLLVFAALRNAGYEHLIIYQNNGDLLLTLSLTMHEPQLRDLANYYMGRNTTLYADICAFHRHDEVLFNDALAGERAYFAGLRGFHAP